MNDKERLDLEKAVTTLVDGIFHWQNNTGVITLYLGKTLEDDYVFGAMPACEAEGIVLQTWTLGDLEDLTGITEDCTEEDKKLGIKLICENIEQGLKEGAWDEQINEEYAFTGTEWD